MFVVFDRKSASLCDRTWFWEKGNLRRIVSRVFLSVTYLQFGGEKWEQGEDSVKVQPVRSMHQLVLMDTSLSL